MSAKLKLKKIMVSFMGMRNQKWLQVEEGEESCLVIGQLKRGGNNHLGIGQGERDGVSLLANGQ